MNHKNNGKAPSPISLRLTKEERAALEHAAAGQSLSAHIRSCLFGENTSTRKRQRRVPVKDEIALAQTLGLLGRSKVASNLNQIAKAANCGALILDQETAAQIDEAHAHVVEMRAMLIRALGLIEERER